MRNDFASVFPLKRSRAHEVVTGGAGFVFAAIVAGMTDRKTTGTPNLDKKLPVGSGPQGGGLAGTVVWCCENRKPTLNPEGLLPYCDPGRFLITRTQTHLDVLASAETALRSGAVPLVVAEVSERVGLTEGRRLQLAAEAGRSTAVLIVPDGGGSNAAETRWQCRAVMTEDGLENRVFNPLAVESFDSTHWRWSLIKNKTGTLSEWIVRWDAATRRVIVVSEIGG
ncbi:MAG: hypothetical protein HWE23_03945 [Rhodobacteraceae bacterium]|nr:hypothetical protein [Paracoccaceae bacterium]